ncbi:MAG: hypothetical protein ACFFG0_11475 [Candidatus Thorarchaeota archaeon]
MSDGQIPGKAKECGHFCGNDEFVSLCCRCHTPKNGERFLLYDQVCDICHEDMQKYVDGNYFQRCPLCGRVVKTVHQGYPVLAPMNNCGCKTKSELRK